MLTYSKDSWLHRLLRIPAEVNVVSTNMSNIISVLEKNVDGTVIDYLNDCIDESAGSIDSDIVADEEQEYKDNMLTDAEIPEFHKDYV